MVNIFAKAFLASFDVNQEKQFPFERQPCDEKSVAHVIFSAKVEKLVLTRDASENLTFSTNNSTAENNFLLSVAVAILPRIESIYQVNAP